MAMPASLVPTHPTPAHDLRALPKPTPSNRWEVFREVVEARRAVRYFDTSVKELPDEDIRDCLDMALLAPSSSNLQPWQFVRVKDPATKLKIAQVSLMQPGAATATEIIVCLGRTDRWREFRDGILRRMAKDGISFPPPFARYYEDDVPVMYTQGPFGIVGFVKRVLCAVVRLFKPLPTIPCSNEEMKWWALKNTAFATENLMLALAAKGYASCPMDGHDKGRVRKILGLPKGAHPLVVLGVGKPAPEDVKTFGPRVRLDRELFVSEV